jgi:hypothetical protein
MLNSTAQLVAVYTSSNSYCTINYLIASETFVAYFQQTYSAIFCICAVIVKLVYSMVYRFLFMRMRRQTRVVHNHRYAFWDCFRGANTTETEIGWRQTSAETSAYVAETSASITQTSAHVTETNAHVT